MPDDELLAGNDLLDDIDEFLRINMSLLQQIKISTLVGENVRVIAMRCRAIEALADFLADHVKVAVLAHQHDVVLVVGNVVLLGGDVSWLKRRNERGREVDITSWKGTFEVKNGVDIGASEVKAFVNEYFDEMVASKPSKHAWWLCYLLRRPEPKGKIGEICMYYLVIVEIVIDQLTSYEASRVSVGDEAMKLADELEKKVIAEDAVDEGFLVPVKNVWIVDKLRMENQQKDKIIEDQANALLEKDKSIAKERKEKNALAKENAELKKQLGLK